MSMYYRDKTLSNRFKQCRLDKDLTQKELATLLNQKRRSIINYEKSKTGPKMEIMLKMHRIFEVSLDYMLCLDDYRDHIDYIHHALGIDDKLLDLISSIDDEHQIKRINNYIRIHYKEHRKCKESLSPID